MKGFDRPPAGGSSIKNLFEGSGDLEPAISNIYMAGSKVVIGILLEWNSTYGEGIPSNNYVGNIFRTLGGKPDFGSSSSRKNHMVVAES